MPRKESNATARTLYRLVDVHDLHAAVRERYIDDVHFEMHDAVVGGREALLVLGTMVTEHAKWAQDVESLTGLPATIGNITAAGALLLRRANDGAWAITFGMGFQLIDQAFVDSSFGQRVAIRLADPTQISSVTRSAIDSRAQIARVTVPSGDGLNGFGFEAFGEMATRIVVRGTAPGLTHDGKVTVRGADALNIPLGKTADELLADLDHIDGLLATDPPPGMSVLEQLVPIRKPASLVSALDEQLANALTTDEERQLGLAWPFEHIGDNEPPTHFKLMGSRAGRGSSALRDGLPVLDDLISPLVGLAAPLQRLKQMKVQLFSSADEGDPISTAIPARKWLAFETSHDGKRYCLFDGQWYRMDEQYAARLLRLTEEIFRKQLEPRLPAWTASMKKDGKYIEAEYNKALAAQLGGICLDQKLIRTDAHPRGFEACDVLLSDGSLVHVKKFDSSAPASHLFAQAYVSTHALTWDQQAVERLRERVASEGGDPSWVKDRPERVVLGMARRTEVTAQSLFTFSRVNLVRAAQDIEGRRIDVYVAPIDIE